MENEHQKTIKVIVICLSLALILVTISAVYYILIYKKAKSLKDLENIIPDIFIPEVKEENISFKKDTYYVGENETILIGINNPDNIEYELQINDENLGVLNNLELTGLTAGKTTLTLTTLQKKVIEATLYIVRGMGPRPNEFDKKKAYVSCDSFTEEENRIIDEALQDRLNDVVYPSRASVVEAARFLTLSFTYRIPYFYENGRLNNYVPAKHVDGEGRYYHKGLYLSSSKYADLEASFVGPAAWGCKLKNFQTKEKYGYYRGQMKPNGFDCSGFISWILYNGGYDVGDVGAGDLPERKDDLYDLGEKKNISVDILKSGQVKVGDLIAYFGHMALIAGIDENYNYYIAESLPYLKGAVIKKYTPEEAVKNFVNVMLMDSVYQNDGKLTNMWY